MAVNTTYAESKTAGNYTPEVVAEMNMIGKIAYSVLKNVQASNPLSVFEKVPVDNGDTIEQSVVRLIEAQPYNRNGANVLKRWLDQHTVTRYYNEWTREKFVKSIDYSDIRKVITGRMSDTDVAQMVIGTIGESDTYDRFTRMKGLLNYGREHGFRNVGTVAANDYKGILKKIKDTVKGMQFVSNKYNGVETISATISVQQENGQVTDQLQEVPFLQRSRAEDIFIVMPYSLKNALDVDELASVFNLDKADIKDKIIEVDDIDGEETYVYIVDKNAILNYTRLYEMVDQLNSDGLFWNYILHTDRMYAVCPLFNATYFKVGE